MDQYYLRSKATKVTSPPSSDEGIVETDDVAPIAVTQVDIDVTRTTLSTSVDTKSRWRRRPSPRRLGPWMSPLRPSSRRKAFHIHGISGPSADHPLRASLGSPSWHSGPPVTQSFMSIEKKHHRKPTATSSYIFSPAPATPLPPTPDSDRRSSSCTHLVVAAIATKFFSWFS